jgi:hypothetical protein
MGDWPDVLKRERGETNMRIAIKAVVGLMSLSATGAGIYMVALSTYVAEQGLQVQASVVGAAFALADCSQYIANNAAEVKCEAAARAEVDQSLQSAKAFTGATLPRAQ